MKPEIMLRKAVRDFYTWIAAVFVAAAGPLLASRVVHSDQPALRILAVLLGTVTFVPMVLVIARIIRDGDEFLQRVHLVAISWAFGGSFLLISLLDWLTRAAFIEQPSLALIWLMIAMLWAIAIAIVGRRYRSNSGSDDDSPAGPA